MRRGVAVRQAEGGASSDAASPALRLVPHEDAAPDSAHVDWLSAQCDRLFEASSMVPTTPLLDVRAFGWTCALRRHWAQVAAEAHGSGAVRAQDHPTTAAIVASIPGLLSASFERIQPGVCAVTRQRGGRAVLTCHLGLTIPRAGDLRMRVGRRLVRWAEGETLLFDETQADARWNDGAQAGLILVTRVKRPMRQPGRWIADRMLR